MATTLTKKQVFFILFTVLGVLFVAMLFPFLTTIVLAVMLAVLFLPVYRWLLRRLSHPWLASGLTVLCFLVVLCLPLFGMGTIIFRQSQNLSEWVVDQGGVTVLVDGINETIVRYLPLNTFDLGANIKESVGDISTWMATLFTATLSTLFSFILILVSLFYFLKDGKQWRDLLTHLSPLSEESDRRILKAVRDAINGMTIGYLLIGVLQGVLVGLGFWLFHIPNAALWGLFAGLVSFIPTIGTSLVAIPAIVYLLLMDRVGAAVGMTLWSAAIVGGVDDLIKPYIVGRNIKVHPLLILFAILGGIALMGPVGVLIGPLIVSVLYALVGAYKNEMI